MWYKSIFLVTLVCLGVTGSLTAQAEGQAKDKPLSDVVDLVDVYQQALNQDAQLRVAEARFQAAQEAKPQAWAALLPHLNATTSYTNDDSSAQFPITGQQSAFFSSRSNNRYTGQYSLNLDQVIYHHDLILQLKKADKTIAEATANREAAGQDLIMRVSQAYFNVLSAQDNLEFARAQKQALASQLDQAQKRFNVGVIPVTDVKQAKANRDSAQAQVINSQNQLDVAIERLRVITGRHYDRLAGLSKRLKFVKPQPADISQWVATAKQNNLQLKAAEFAAKVASLEVRKQRAGHYPTLDLAASKTQTRDFSGTLDGATTDDATIGIQLNIPLFAGGSVFSQTRQANDKFNQAQARTTQQRRQAIEQARSSYKSVLHDISRVKALEQAVVSNKASLDAVRSGFKVGTRTSVDVLVSVRDLFSARSDYASGRFDYLLDTLKLKQAAGTLSAKDIYEINRFMK